MSNWWQRAAQAAASLWRGLSRVRRFAQGDCQTDRGWTGGLMALEPRRLMTSVMEVDVPVDQVGDPSTPAVEVPADPPVSNDPDATVFLDPPLGPATEPVDSASDPDEPRIPDCDSSEVITSSSAPGEDWSDPDHCMEEAGQITDPIDYGYGPDPMPGDPQEDQTCVDDPGSVPDPATTTIACPGVPGPEPVPEIPQLAEEFRQLLLATELPPTLGMDLTVIWQQPLDLDLDTSGMFELTMQVHVEAAPGIWDQILTATGEFLGDMANFLTGASVAQAPTLDTTAAQMTADQLAMSESKFQGMFDLAALLGGVAVGQSALAASGLDSASLLGRIAAGGVAGGTAGLGIEGGHQIVSGEFDPGSLALSAGAGMGLGAAGEALLGALSGAFDRALGRLAAPTVMPTVDAVALGDLPLPILNSEFTPSASALMQNMTTQVNDSFIADITVAARQLRPAETAIAGSNPGVDRMLYGKAVERGVRDLIESDPVLDSLFRHMGGANQPDFIGKGIFEGQKFDITTPGQVAAHLARPYGQNMNIAVYHRSPAVP